MECFGRARPACLAKIQCNVCEHCNCGGCVRRFDLQELVSLAEAPLSVNLHLMNISFIDKYNFVFFIILILCT